MKKIKVELHTHTNYSYDSDTSFDQIIKKCKQEKIYALGVSDHNEIEGALRLSKLAPFKIIVGQEILTQQGEVIGFFLTKFIKAGQSIKETIKQIKRQGGIVYLPHPFDKTTRKTAVTSDGLDQIIKEVDIVEVHNGRTIYGKDNKKSLEYAKKHKKTFAVGSDSHTVFEFGRNYLLMDQFSDAQSFLKSMRTAKLQKAQVIPWVFLLTKLARFRKRNFPPKSKIGVLPSGIECDVCGSKKYTIQHKKSGRAKTKYFISDDSYGVHPQIVKCVDCNLIYCYPRENKNTIVKRYKQFIDETYEKERPARKQNQVKIIANIEKLLNRKGKVLDIGAATGAFLEAAKEVGWKTFGIEPSKWAVEYAKKNFNLTIAQGTLEKAKFKPASFDAITLIDVIEHVDSPRQLLLEVKKLLSQDGVVVLVTPNIQSLLFKLLGEKWWHVRPDHIYYFNHETLNLLVESLGFKIVKVQSAGWNFSYNYWISRFKNNLTFIYSLFSLFKNIPILNLLTKRNYYVNFGDSMEIYLKKNEV